MKSALSPVHSLERTVENTTESESFFALLLGLFAAVALALVAAGIYGVFSYWVSQHVREIGLRVALGATGWQILQRVVGRGLTVTVAGLLAGLLATVASARVLARAFQGVHGADPLVLGGVSLVLLSVAALACLVPARRASRIEPSIALRCE